MRTPLPARIRLYPAALIGTAWCLRSGGQLGALAGLSLGKLDISRVAGFTVQDAAAFGAGCAALQAGGVMGAGLELVAAQCDWADGQLTQLMAGVAFQKLDLSKPKQLSPADLATVCAGAAAMQQQQQPGAGGVMPAEPALILRYCEEGGPLIQAVGRLGLGRLDVSWGGELAAADLASLANNGAQHSPDLELIVQYTDWAEDGRLADGLADLVRKAALVARSHHDDPITMIASLLCHVTVAAASLSLLRHRARAVVQRLGQLDLTGGLGLTKLDHRFLNKVLCRVIGRPDDPAGSSDDEVPARSTHVTAHTRCLWSTKWAVSQLIVALGSL